MKKIQIQRSTVRRALGARILAPLALAGAATILVSGTAPAADRFVAGQVGVSRSPLTAVETTRFSARARVDAATLGLPTGVRRTATRIANRFTDSTYVEVTALDANGQPVSLARYGADGRLRTAIRLGWKGPSRAIATDLAAGRARMFALAAGMQAAGTTGGSEIVARSPDGGFAVTWPRRVDGVPVPGDGVRVVLWPDGTLHSVAAQERALTAVPASQLAQADAERLAAAQLATWLGPVDRAAARISGTALAWIAPNDMFVAARPDAPASTLRLAWVVSVAASGRLSDHWRALEIYLDAGDGALLGGDILR